MKHPQLTYLLYLMLLIFAFSGCVKKKVEVSRAMYYWQSYPFTLYNEDLKWISQLQVERLYVKFFEVEPDDLLFGRPVSKTNLSLNNILESREHSDSVVQSLGSIEIIPVIFINHEILDGMSEGQADSLAMNIVFLTDKLVRERFSFNNVDVSEIQIDCDYTERTRDSYFALLKHIKRHSGLQLSCTLRLYPYKYPKKMGIPPVDRAMLMCYNLTSPMSDDRKNSILETSELEKYLLNADKYPIPLDIALPIFSYTLHFRNGEFTGTLNLNFQELKPYIDHVEGHWYKLRSDVTLYGHYLREGDDLKIERISITDLEKSAELLLKYVELSKRVSLAFFHLNSDLLNEYEITQLSAIYNSFVY